MFLRALLLPKPPASRHTEARAVAGIAHHHESNRPRRSPFTQYASHRPSPSDLRSAGDATKNGSESSSLKKPPRPPAAFIAAGGALAVESKARWIHGGVGGAQGTGRSFESTASQPRVPRAREMIRFSCLFLTHSEKRGFLLT